MIENDLYKHINCLDPVFPVLLSVVQMPLTDLRTHLLDTDNLSHIQKALITVQKESYEIKKIIVGQMAHQSDQQFTLLKEKNAEFVNLQNRFSETEKHFSLSKLEIAELKKAIAIQEAENAQLITENLALKSKFDNLSLKHNNIVVHNNNCEELKNRVDQLSHFNTGINKSLEEELKKANILNSELQSKIIKLRIDLEQTKAVSANYKDLSNKEKTTQEIKDLKTRLEKVEEKNKKLKTKLGEYQKKYANLDLKFTDHTEHEKDMTKLIANKLMELGCNLASNFGVKGSIIAKKIDMIEAQVFDVKTKLMVIQDTKKENFFLAEQVESSKESLEFAMQSMASLADVSNENQPSSNDVIDNGELLNIYLADIHAKILEKAIEKSHSTPKSPTQKQQLNTTLSTINDLMGVMTEQMENEHKALMFQISDDKELPSFRRTVSSPYSKK